MYSRYIRRHLSLLGCYSEYLAVTDVHVSVHKPIEKDIIITDDVYLHSNYGQIVAMPAVLKSLD